MNKFVKIFLIITGIVFIFIIIYDKNENNKNRTNEPQTIINDSNTYNTPWRSPRDSEYAEIGKLITQNNIKICGEYHVKKVASGEYLIACSPNGINWQYFVAYTKIGKFYRASDKMVSKLTPPR